jgi:hypothetical protein
MDNQQIKNFIETSRKAGVKDEKIVAFLQGKGVSARTRQFSQSLRDS